MVVLLVSITYNVIIDIHNWGWANFSFLNYRFCIYHFKYIFLKSYIGIVPSGIPNAPSYSVSKASVIHMTKSLASVLSWRGINVTCISPGFIMSDMSKGILGDEETAAESIPVGM